MDDFKVKETITADDARELAIKIHDFAVKTVSTKGTMTLRDVGLLLSAFKMCKDVTESQLKDMGVPFKVL